METWRGASEGVEDGGDLGGGDAGFVFVDECVVELAAFGDAEAVGLLACEVEHLFEEWREGGEVVGLAG